MLFSDTVCPLTFFFYWPFITNVTDEWRIGQPGIDTGHCRRGRAVWARSFLHRRQDVDAVTLKELLLFRVERWNQASKSHGVCAARALLAKSHDVSPLHQVKNTNSTRLPVWSVDRWTPGLSISASRQQPRRSVRSCCWFSSDAAWAGHFLHTPQGQNRVGGLKTRTHTHRERERSVRCKPPHILTIYGCHHTSCM